MQPITRFAFLLGVLLLFGAACGAFTDESTMGGNSASIQFCPDAQDAIATANGLPLPFPANPANPTSYDPALPPPTFFHACLSASGAPTYRAGVLCTVCSVDNYHADLAPGSFACTDSEPDGTVVVCVAPIADGQLDSCNAALNGCQ